MSRKSASNARRLRTGDLMRLSDLDRGGGRRPASARLLPSLADRPAGSGPVDPERLAAELAWLSEVGRRAASG